MLSPAVQELVETVSRRFGRRDVPAGDAQGLHAFVSTAASFYEKVRYLVDYREEHTIRRNAIERIIKRKLFIEGGVDIGAELIRELANGKYVPHSFVTDESAQALDAIINAYVLLIERSNLDAKGRRVLASFAASEVDRFLSSEKYFLDDSVVRAFFISVRDRIDVGEPVDPEWLDLEIHAGIRRALLRSDDDMVRYSLFATLAPHWRKGTDAEQVALADGIGAILQRIGKALEDPLQHEIARALKNETVSFVIIREFLQRYGAGAEAAIADPEKLEAFTRDFLARKYEAENASVKTGGLRAVVYLFITKMILALVVELPYEIYFLGGVALFPLLTNIIFHPLVLFAFTRSVPKLGVENTNLAVANISSTVFGLDAKPIKVRRTTSPTGLTAFFSVAYGAFALCVFGLIVWILRSLHFNPVSIALFIFFLALVSFFAYRIRANARRFKVTRDSGGLPLFGRLLTLPIVQFGRWLSTRFSSVNVFVFILDFVIETPFKVILGFSDSFLTYLEKKVGESY